MKEVTKYALAMTVVAALSPLTLSAEPQPTPAPKTCAITLAYEASVLPSVLDAIRLNLTRTFSCGVRLAELPPSFGGLTGVQQEAAIREIMKSGELMAIALVHQANQEGFRAARYPKVNAAVVNLAVLETPGADTSTVNPQYIGRSLRESVRVAARLLGMEECKNPRCGLRKPEQDPVRDAIGTNLCPPCSRKSKALLSEKGFRPEIQSR